MSKGVLGFGCSYTWGEGLYFYSDLDGLPFKEFHEFDSQELRYSHHCFRRKHTYTNKVAEHYNTWGVTNGGNGGDNIFSFQQRYTSIFNDNENSAKIDDFKLIIFQFTMINRNTNYSMSEQLELINHHLEKLEQNGIKCVTIVWPYDITESDSLYWKLFKDRHVPIRYNETIYDNFEDIIKIPNNDITVCNDFKDKGFQKNDEHLNIKGHTMLANSIIEKLEKDNFKL